MLMATQTHVLQMQDSENIINGVAEKSELLLNLLMYRSNNNMSILILFCITYNYI